MILSSDLVYIAHSALALAQAGATYAPFKSDVAGTETQDKIPHRNESYLLTTRNKIRLSKK